MEDWDAQKMLDKYIHDYMIRKNMHTTAEIFAKEAEIAPEPAEGTIKTLNVAKEVQDVRTKINRFFTQHRVDRAAMNTERSADTNREERKTLSNYLREERFLIVLDDVWTAKAWIDLRDAFPKSNKLGKILITNRHEEVARQANPHREPHNLRLLTHQESWLLFRLEVFGEPICPSKLEDNGRLIVDQCDRLPLAIVVIAGILV
ncbi:hypothetical protein F511_12510 [Dorcoceras hygrometricum]|uniref:NB-ARC domain-containing protein n=1 Tax=Dorcoceras hygrometricum TaxID=472368 RepID=A0A2Z7DFU9_9LAMI|nr:hypothetical protein F511_12510 [Dorcoceras hygrometricum]